MITGYEEIYEALDRLQAVRQECRLEQDRMRHLRLTNGEAFHRMLPWQQCLETAERLYDEAFERMPLRNQIVFMAYQKERAAAAEVIKFPG